MIIPDPIVLASVGSNAYTNSCVFGGTTGASGTLNTNGWLQINLLVVLVSFMVSAVIYTFADLFPVSMKEKLKGASKYEAFQGVISIVIILAILAFASVTCNVGAAITSSSASLTHISYQDPIQFSEMYLNNLMYQTGLGLFSNIYQESMILTLAGNIGDSIDEIINSLAFGPLHISIGSVFQVYYGYSSALTGTFTPLIAVTFGILFTMWLLLNLIESLALTVIVPVSIILRSIPFGGPKIRESADTLMSLAIGFYFILPLAILLNVYVVTWIHTPCSVAGQVCNPYQQYTLPYTIGQVSASSFLNSAPQSAGSGALRSISLSNSFFSGGLLGIGGIGNGILMMLQSLVAIPAVTLSFGQQVASYIFQGIVLLGLDMAIVIGFSQGLTKGLNSVSRMLSVGPFWGNI